MLEDLSYINARDLLESTGISNISESNGEISFSCPSSEHFHGDNSPSARMNSRTTAALCHSCGWRGNAITFLSWHKSLPETVARRLLEERYGGGGISAGVGTLEEEVNRIMNPVVVEEEKRLPPAESWLEVFYEGIHSHKEAQDYLGKRGFKQQISEEWSLGYDDYSKRITIPVRDIDGKLVGFKGRAIEDGPYPKYMILGRNRNNSYYDFDPYKKSEHVFGLNKFKDWDSYIVKGYLVEGELNAIAMEQHGYMAIGIAGSEFSEKQCELIREYCTSIVIFLDNDKAGEKGTKKVVEMLSPYMTVRIVQNAPGDAAELDTQTVKELVRNSETSLVLQTQGKL